MKVHTILGPGLLESAYETCLAHELRKRGLSVESQVHMPVFYDGVRVELAYRIDLVVEEVVIVEIKAISKLVAIHEAQLLSQLKLSTYKLGLLINFHEAHLKNGIKRLVNGL
ncbi:MAG: GxxExxY protein [Gemmatimonadota bacterium]|nr:GxxExxY protein [Gemmatimonadota bacterium]